MKTEEQAEQGEMTKKTEGPEMPRKSISIEDKIALPRTSSRLADKPRADYRELHTGAPKRPPRATVEGDAEADAELAHHLCLLTLSGTEMLSEPHNVEEAKKSKYWPYWKAAMDCEMDQLKKLKVYELQDIPPGRKPIGCKWVFRLKCNENGDVKEFKARLIAKGFAQIPGMDLLDTFVPVIRMDSI